MTVSEVKERILKGECLSDMFEFTDGQECLIYKGEWNPGDEVIYIPDIYLNEICINRTLVNILDEEEIKDVFSCLYTGKDFMELADGNEGLAKELFYYCDWQHPSTALNEVIDGYEQDLEYEKENEKDGETKINSYPELKKYDEEHAAYLAREEDGEFEIIFEVDKERYYCYIGASNIDEALGIFFVNHPHVNYDMIVDHMEV